MLARFGWVTRTSPPSFRCRGKVAVCSRGPGVRPLHESAEPVICRFYRLIPDAPEPRRADRSAEGTLPVNAYRYCEAIASASAFGWYLYPPLSFSLIWDGAEIAW